MNIPKELVEQWWDEAYANNIGIHYIAQRAAQWALSQPVSMEPVAWRDKHNKFDLYVSNINQLDAEPLYTATQLAAARQQGAEEVENKWLNDIMKMTERIADLEKSNAQLLEALKDSWNPTLRSAEREAKARAAIETAEVKP